MTLLILGASLLISSLLIHDFTPIDFWFSDYFYDFEMKQWFVNHDIKWIKSLFYNSPKTVIYIGAGILASYMLYLFFKKNWRTSHVFFAGAKVLLILALTPLVVVVGKDTSNVHCPYEFTHYNGRVPVVKIFTIYDPVYRKQHGPGRCFPGGHASGGYALFSLSFLGVKRKTKMLGWVVGGCMGTAMSAYQTMRGAHFLSHTLATIGIALMVMFLVDRFIEKVRPENPAH